METSLVVGFHLVVGRMKSLCFISGAAVLGVSAAKDITKAGIEKQFNSLPGADEFYTDSAYKVFEQHVNHYNLKAAILKNLVDSGSVPADAALKKGAYDLVVSETQDLTSLADGFVKMIKEVNSHRTKFHTDFQKGMTALAGGLDNVMKQLVALGQKLDKPAFEKAFPAPFAKIEELKKDVNEFKRKGMPAWKWIVGGVSVSVAVGAVFFYLRRK